MTTEVHARAEIERGAGTRFDPVLARRFLEIEAEHPAPEPAPEAGPESGGGS